MAKKFAIGMGALILALAGCAHQKIHITVVDATTGAPLVGVNTQWIQARHKMLQPLAQLGPTNLPLSSQDGLIEVDRVRRGWKSTFVFSCSGYSNVYGAYYSDTLDLSDEAVYYPPGSLAEQFSFVGKSELAIKRNGYLIVPMHK